MYLNYIIMLEADKNVEFWTKLGFLDPETIIDCWKRMLWIVHARVFRYKGLPDEIHLF